MTKQKIKYSFLAFTLIISISATAQDLNKEVYVVRPYEPTLSDATKYNFTPSANEAETTAPAFHYSITSKPVENSFIPEPIKAAKTVTTSLPKIYKSWLKLGLGNYGTPLVEFNISNLRSKEYAYGAYLYYKSSMGHIVLDNDDKVRAGYVENKINVYGKRFFPKATLSGNLRFDHRTFHYYGYNTNLFVDDPKMSRDSVRQKTYNPGLDLSLASDYTDKDQLNYNITASVDGFFDKDKNKEGGFVLRTSLSKEFYGLLGGLDMKLDYSKLTGNVDTTTNTIFCFNPWISKSSEDWKFKLGFEAVADAADITHFYFYPQANLDIIIVKEVLVPFIGLSGALQKNSYQQLSAENQFIKPGYYAKNTSSNLIVYGGIKGNISSLVRFRADVTYTLYKNFHFFVNDTITVDPRLPLQNQFVTVYDDVDLITYHGQLAVQPMDNFELVVDGKYFDYETYKEEKAWNMPDYKIGIDGNYSFSNNKFVIGADINVIGTRWMKGNFAADEMVKIKPVMDANLSFNYHYSKVLTIFADLNNLAGRSYLLWNQYPAERFNFMFGFSYKL
jgi:hypothetical protein